MRNFHKDFRKFLEANNQEAAQNLLNDIDNYTSILGMDVLDNHVFWELDFTFLKHPHPIVEKLILHIQKLELEFTQEFADFFSSLSKEGFLKLAGTHLEQQICLKKYEATWHQKHNQANNEKTELIRQQETAQFIGVILQRLVNRFFHTLPITDKVPYPSYNQLVLAEKAFHLLAQIAKGTHYLDLYLSGLWDGKIEENNISLYPKEGLEKKALELSTNYHSPHKYRCFYNVCERIAANNVLEYMELINQPAIKSKRNDTVLLNTLDSKVGVEAFKIGIEALGNVFLKLPSLEMQGIDLKAIPTLELKTGVKINLLDLLEVTNFLHELSIKSIHVVQHDFEEAINVYYNKFISKSSENFLLYLDLKNLTKCSPNEKKILAKKIYSNPIFKEYQKFVLSNANEKTISSPTLCHYDYNELIEYIHLGTSLLKENIKNIIDLFSKATKTNILYQPLYQFNNNIYWIPSAVAFHNFIDNLFEIAIQDDLIALHVFQTDYFETGLSRLFQKHGYKTIVNEEDKIIYEDTPRGRESISDFDTLAYKDGHLFHFEVKLSSKHRNSFFDKKVWYDRQLSKAANKQIPNQRKYILENRDKIAEILGLSPNEHVIEIHSYIVSNTTDFDGEHIEGLDELGSPHSYKKINFYELFYLLNSLEQDMHLPEDIFKLLLKRIDKQGKHRVPSHFRDWAHGKAELPNKKEFVLMAIYIKTHLSMIWHSKKERPPQLLEEYINTNLLFNYLDDEIDFQELSHNLGSLSINIKTPCYPIK